MEGEEDDLAARLARTPLRTLTPPRTLTLALALALALALSPSPCSEP